jgi:hypothetical protein
MGHIPDGRFRFAEGVLQENQQVSVGGQASREVHPQGQRSGSREPPERVALRGIPGGPLVISDSRKAIRG